MRAPQIVATDTDSRSECANHAVHQREADQGLGGTRVDALPADAEVSEDPELAAFKRDSESLRRAGYRRVIDLLAEKAPLSSKSVHDTSLPAIAFMTGTPRVDGRLISL